MALTAEEFEGQTVKSLKTLLAKQIGVPRFRQRWLSEDHSELSEEALATACDVQLIVLDFVQTDVAEIVRLFYSCKRNLLEEVEEPMRKPLDPNVTSIYAIWMTPLHVAAVSGHVDCVALLLEAGSYKDAVDVLGRTALHFAAEEDHLEVVRLLLEVEADRDVVDEDGMTVLGLAEHKGHLEIVNLLKAELGSQ